MPIRMAHHQRFSKNIGPPPLSFIIKWLIYVFWGVESKRVIITRIEKRRPHLYTGITDEISFLLDSFTMFLNIFCPW